MTREVVRAEERAHINERTLQEGRTLFVSRCIECHTLPVVSRYDPVAWPWLVNDMSARAGLKTIRARGLDRLHSRRSRTDGADPSSGRLQIADKGILGQPFWRY